jgi:malate dehydrogenase (oxaloacetate-decarboxylating)(NADP+)
MKIAAVEALANLAREDVPDAVTKAYDDELLQFARSISSPSR